MTDPVAIAFIGFGEAARAFTQSLRGIAALRVSAYDIALTGNDPARAADIRDAAARLDVPLAASAPEAVQGARLVFSAVTAAQSLAALGPLAGHLRPGQTVVDINSVAAARKVAAAHLVRAQGAGYVDMAVMAPVHPAGHRTPVLLAGDLGGDTGALLDRLGFRAEVAGAAPGDATAIKMVRSLFVKGLEAVTVQALAAAAASGCHDRVLASLSASFAGLGWPGFAGYEFERVITHGRRRAEELREVAATMNDLGFAAGEGLAQAIADVQEAVAASHPAVAPGADAAALAQAVAEALRAAAPRKAFGT